METKEVKIQAPDFTDIGRIKYADVNWYYFCNFFKYSNSNG